MVRDSALGTGAIGLVSGDFAQETDLVACDSTQVICVVYLLKMYKFLKLPLKKFIKKLN